jgi:hypothetical protein
LSGDHFRMTGNNTQLWIFFPPSRDLFPITTAQHNFLFTTGNTCGWSHAPSTKAHARSKCASFSTVFLAHTVLASEKKFCSFYLLPHLMYFDKARLDNEMTDNIFFIRNYNYKLCSSSVIISCPSAELSTTLLRCMGEEICNSTEYSPRHWVEVEVEVAV